jgi:hypothetical protein
MTIDELSLRLAELSAALGDGFGSMSAWWLLAPVVLFGWLVVNQ